VTATFICANAQTYSFEPESFGLILPEQRRELLNVSAASGYRGAVPPACAVNCAVIATAHDTSGQTGQNCDREIAAGNREFWPVS
jgi:hypothetical protein